jgi:hypothetical protein
MTRARDFFGDAMPTRTGLIGLSIALVGASAAAQGEPPSMAFGLHLHCVGRMTAPAVIHPAGTTAPAAPAADEVFVDIEGDQGRVRLPGGHSAGDAVWKPISDLLVDENEVSGRVSTDPWTFWSRPLMRIDRITGRIELAGPKGVGFHGDCAAYDPNEMRRF